MPVIPLPCSRLFLRLTVVGVLVAVGFVAGAWSAFTLLGTPTRQPTTCKELAERLRGQGLRIEWELYRDQSGMAAVVVFDHSNNHAGDATEDACRNGQTPYVIITQYHRKRWRNSRLDRIRTLGAMVGLWFGDSQGGSESK